MWCENDLCPVSLPRSGSDQRDGRRRKEAGRRLDRPIPAGYDWTLRQNRRSNDKFGRHGWQGRGWGSACTSYCRTTAGQPQGSSTVPQTHTFTTTVYQCSNPQRLFRKWMYNCKVTKYTKYGNCGLHDVQDIEYLHWWLHPYKHGVVYTRWCMDVLCSKYWLRAPPRGRI